MGSIATKLAYLADAVNDIQAAITEGGIAVEDSVELARYGDLIRELSRQGQGGIQDYVPFTEIKAFNELEIQVLPIEDVTDLYVQ